MRLPERAVPHCKEGDQLKPNFPEYENNLGTAYAAAKQWDKAIEYFPEKAADNISTGPATWPTRTWCRPITTRATTEGAIEYYKKKSVEFYKDYAPAYISMKISYEALKEWDNARWQPTRKPRKSNPTPLCLTFRWGSSTCGSIIRRRPWRSF
ncbi:MAG: tetratricopeptide repeat protein [Desulfobacterales bacterium]|nr:tetratricopeptide repeat protein [Desulfobacterales bacterium]